MKDNILTLTISSPEVTALTQEDFASRRARLMDSLSDGAIILTAGHMATRNSDVEHEYRQDSTFWYLTGFDEPDAVAVLRPGHEEHPYVLFVNPFDPKFEIWVGQRAGVDGAKQHLGADEAFPIEELEEKLPELLEETNTLYHSLGSDQEMDRLVTDLVKRRRSSGQRNGRYIQRVADPGITIASMRVVKSAKEIESLQRAIDITAQGFDAAIRETRAGQREYHIQTPLENEFRRLGSPRNGYPSIVASGENSCILHYIKNRRELQDGDLLLIDAGAEVDYYGADITRTWPVSGKFTPEQRDVYDIVLEAQKKAIELIAPGVEFGDVHKKAREVLIQGLKDFGILKGDIDHIIEEKEHEPYYMHGTSHWLGLDVHDAGIYKNGDDSVLLQEGMVFTVEPGLYFGRQVEDAPEYLKGIGIRIEDDLVVTADGYRVMSSAIPKEPGDLEALVGMTAS
jgi:Xaa-Pro aminopeptidase